MAGARREEITARVVLHRFAGYLTAADGHDRLSSVVPRDGFGWPDHLADGLGPSTVSHNPASEPGFLAPVAAQGRGALPEGNPTLVLPPLEPRALTPARSDP